MLPAEAAVTDRWPMSVLIGRDLRLADLNSRRAPGFDVTAWLGANEQYDASQAFAADALGAGLAGIRYLVRRRTGAAEPRRNVASVASHTLNSW
jgi:hypothetical protein